MSVMLYPNPNLKLPSERAEPGDPEIRRMIPDMVALMYSKRGIGLAGPQAGFQRQIVVSNLAGNPSGPLHVYLNPKIIWSSPKIVTEPEGCLSLPGMNFEVGRSDRVIVRYELLDGKTVEKEASDLEARMFQHEIDHLNGALILDRTTQWERDQNKDALKALEDKYREENP